MTVAWWAGLAPVRAAGPAEGHDLEWRDGDLRLLAHPDPEAEIALGALGGERCPCLDVLDAWIADHARGTCLVVGRRAPDDLVSRPTEAVDAIGADLARWRGARASLVADARAAADGDVVDRLTSKRWPEEEAAVRRLGGLLLLGLDDRLQRRLQASVAAALADRADALAALTAATAARALDPLRRVGWSGGLADVRLGAEPHLTPTTAVLPPTWTAAVWGRGLLTAADGTELVLDVTSVTPEGETTVRTAAPGKAQVGIRVVQWENA